MSSLNFNAVAAALFGVVALCHIARLVLGFPVLIGTLAVPMAFSWAGALVTGTLCVWGFRAKR